jgi:predicted DNA-binding WGR domain protein
MADQFERASTGRARCKICKEPIAKGEFRLGTTTDSSRFDGTMTIWQHAICAAMRSPMPYLRAAAAYEGVISPAHRAQLEAIANTTRARKIKQVIWRHATEPRCLLEFPQNQYALFTAVDGKAVVAKGTLDEVIASVPDDDLEDVVDTATASGKMLGRAEPGKPKPKTAIATRTLHQRFESVFGDVTYSYEIVLDEAKCQVTSAMGSRPTGEPLGPFGKPTKKKLETIELARKYFRYSLLQQRQQATFVDGDRVELDPEEVFRDVKDKSSDYRYVENAKTKQFFDIDRDASNVIVSEGALGTKGTETTHEYNWDGEAKQHYKEMLAAKLGEGYVEPPGLAGRRAAGKR